MLFFFIIIICNNNIPGLKKKRCKVKEHKLFNINIKFILFILNMKVRIIRNTTTFSLSLDILRMREWIVQEYIEIQETTMTLTLAFLMILFSQWRFKANPYLPITHWNGLTLFGLIITLFIRRWSNSEVAYHDQWHLSRCYWWYLVFVIHISRCECDSS